MKRRVHIFVMFCLLVCLLNMNVRSVYAADWTYKDVSQLTDAEIETYALNFASVFCSADLSVSQIQPMYDTTEAIIGYVISYEDGGLPYGYLQLDFRLDDPVAEFCIEANAVNPYDELVSDVTDNFRMESDVKLVKILPFQYGTIRSDHVLYDTHGNAFTEEAVSQLNQEVFAFSNLGVSWSDLFSDDCNSENASVVTNTISVYDPDKSCIDQTYIGQLTGRYACAPVAMTAALNQNDILIDNDIATTFDYLWEESSTQLIDSDKDGVPDVNTEILDDGTVLTYQLGSTNDRNIYRTLYTYFIHNDIEYRGNRVYSPTFDFFQTCVDADCSIILYSARILDNENKTVGHCVNVLGYCEVSYLDSHDSVHYVMAADGWNAGAARYLNIDQMVYRPSSPVLVWFQLGGK